jgi:transcriptional regulator with XRE-family HTH domain
MTEIGKAIKLARVRRGMKQLELAELVGITSNHLSMIENDKRDPSWSLVCKISETLRLPLSLLILLGSENSEMAYGKRLLEVLSLAEDDKRAA